MFIYITSARLSPRNFKLFDKSRRIRAGRSALTKEARVACRIVVDGKIPLGRLDRRREDNIKMDHRHLGCEYVEWILMTQNRIEWRPVVSTVGSMLTN